MIKIFEEFSSEKDMESISDIFESLTDKFDLGAIDCFKGSETIYNFRSKQRIKYIDYDFKDMLVSGVCFYKGGRYGDSYIMDGWLVEDKKFIQRLENGEIDLESKYYSDFYSLGFNTDRDYVGSIYLDIHTEISNCVKRVKSFLGKDIHENKDPFWKNGITNEGSSGYYLPVDWCSDPPEFEARRFNKKIEYWIFFKY